jgi:hypothetical protein
MSELHGIQDYRWLNEITMKDWYPLPLISELVARVMESTYFTKMDLCWGFNNIYIYEGDEEKATFIIPTSLFKLLVMQFSLCNALSTFQQMVNHILKEECKSRHIEVYINNILVHTKDHTSNQYWTRRVLSKLQVNKLFCKKVSV